MAFDYPDVQSDELTKIRYKRKHHVFLFPREMKFITINKY